MWPSAIQEVSTDPIAAANMAVEGITHGADKLVAQVSDAVYNAPGNHQSPTVCSIIPTQHTCV